MPRIIDHEEDEEWRRTFSLSSSPSECPNVFCTPRSSFSYSRLPVRLIKLTVIKLDASSFDVHVARTASVRELKIAIEDVFTKKDGTREFISWIHVWSHFCLSYRGLKLTEEKALLKNFGIKDGDQLHFVRHLSISYTPVKLGQRSRAASSELRRKSWSGPERLDFEFEDSVSDKRRSGVPTAMSDKRRSGVPTAMSDGGKGGRLVVVRHQSPFKLTHYLKGWLCSTDPDDICRSARPGLRDGSTKLFGSA